MVLKVRFTIFILSSYKSSNLLKKKRERHGIDLLLCSKFSCLPIVHLLSEAATEVFFKKGILQNFARFSGKNLCQSPLIKLQADACNFI